MILQTKTRYNDAFYFYANDAVIGKSIGMYGEYCQVEVDLLLKFINEKSVVYDIGANIGYHTCAFASKAAQVFSFEPHPRTFDILLKNAGRFSNVTLFNCAVSNYTGKSKCLDYNIDVSANYGAVSVDTEKGVLDIECMSLNEVIEPLPDLIKIDVEGSEFAVIQGCLTLIARKRPIIYYEAHETKQLSEIYQTLEPLNYKFYWVPVKNYNKNNFKQVQENIFAESVLHSILAMPPQYDPLDLWPVQGKDDTLERLYADQGLTYIRI